MAQAEPIFEDALLRLIPSQHLLSLTERGILTVSRWCGGQQIAFTQPLYAAAVASLTATERRREIAADIYDAVAAENGRHDPVAVPASLVRLVVSGLDSGMDLPIEWLCSALEQLTEEGDVPLRTRIAATIPRHRDVNAMQLGKAALYASMSARLSGDRALGAAAYDWCRRAVERLRPMTSEPDPLYAALEIRLATYEAVDLGDLAASHRRLAHLETVTEQAREDIRESVRSARAAAMAATGRLQEAGDLAVVDSTDVIVPVERARFWSAVAGTMVMVQRGKFTDALDVAEEADAIVALGGVRYRSNTDLLRFCTFLCHWFSGALDLAKDDLTTLRERAVDETHHTGLLDLADVMYANARGRWREAARNANVLIERLSVHDPFVVAPLAHAAFALALAALGERAASARAIRVAEADRFGVGLMGRGLLLTQTLRARLWNNASDTSDAARAVANWAAADRLPMVELMATHVRGLADPGALPALLPRLKALATGVDAPIADVLLQHCDEIANHESAWETPAARLLAESGIWTPLPSASTLSAREREVALLAALGYSSRWIAEHHHLSVRTVETHLRHVFTKIGTSSRDELRHWFRRETSIRRVRSER